MTGFYAVVMNVGAAFAAGVSYPTIKYKYRWREILNWTCGLIFGLLLQLSISLSTQLCRKIM